MTAQKQTATADQTEKKPTLGYRLGQWVQEPLGGVIAASIATIGSFGVVISGMWAISFAVN